MRHGARIKSVLRVEMEHLFGTSFEKVEVVQSRLPLYMGALACTSGQRIYMLPGLSDFDSSASREILGHELTHVVQQRSGLLSEYSGVCNNPELEQEAEEMGKLAACGKTVNIKAPKDIPKTSGCPVWQCIKTDFRGIPGITLLQILDQQVKTILQSGLPPIEKSNDWTYFFTRGWEWLAACGKLAATKYNIENGNGWVPCDLVVGPEGTQMRLDGNGTVAFSERLEFPTEPGIKKDLNYAQIAQQIQALGIVEPLQAEGILYRMAGEQHLDTKPRADFLNTMVALLFGVESSRNQATLATTVMLLDLVREHKGYGRQGVKRFTLSGAFHSSHGYYWDDGQYTHGNFYGGKHPMAVHGTGTGNMGERYGMVANLRDWRELTLNQRHAVPRREISLLVHWLEANVPPNSSSQTFGPMWVHEKIHERLSKAYFDMNPTWHLPGDPSKDTGQHVDMAMYQTGLYVVTDGFQLVGKTVHVSPYCKLIPGNRGYMICPVDPRSEWLRTMTKCSYCWKNVSL